MVRMGAEPGLGEWVDDVTPATWIAPRLHPFNQDTGSVVPDGFEAYCRLFHPVAGGPRWADIAARNGRIVHPEMQLHRISTPRGETPEPGARQASDSTSSWGSLPIAERRCLVDSLRAHTSTPGQCWFAVWYGWGGLDPAPDAARVEHPSRSYRLASGPIDAATDSVLEPPFDQSPSLWWPDDRAWIVATEVDYAWTYVGGTGETIDAVLADDRLETLPARLTDLPFYDSDTLS
jgi:hypothetical protein